MNSDHDAKFSQDIPFIPQSANIADNSLKEAPLKQLYTIWFHYKREKGTFVLEISV